ncbi:MAG: 5-formyltetrahydrofolate cyclo-ligase [Ginsengibacter sp.]
MTKAELRSVYNQKRQSLTVEQQNIMDDLLLIQFQRIPLPFVTIVHSYLYSKTHLEIDTTNILRYLQFVNPDLIVAVPKISKSTEHLQHLVITEDSVFEENKYGINEPVAGEAIDPLEIDLVLTPLLAFDTRGFRVGYGKGFYDRFLTACRPDVIKVGITYFEAEDAISNINEHDIPLDFCITPENLYEF